MYRALIALLVLVIIYLLYVNYWKPIPPQPVAVVDNQPTPAIVVVDATPPAILPLTTYSPWYEGNYVPWRYGPRPRFAGPRFRGGWRRRRH